MAPTPEDPRMPTAQPAADLVRDHVRGIAASSLKERDALLTDLLVQAYPTNLVQDS